MKTKLLGFTLITFSAVVSAEDLNRNTNKNTTAHHRAVKHLDTTPNEASDDAWTFGAEENEYADSIYINPTIDYSGKNNWDFNFTTFNIPVYGNDVQAYQYDAYFGITKTFEVTDPFNIIIGTQNGAPFANSPIQLHNLDFIHFDYDVSKRLSVYIGPFFANKALTTLTDSIGYMAGFEAQLIPGKLHIQGDYTSGQSSISGAEVNLQWYVRPNTQLYMGVIVPERNSGNEFAGVVGFNISTKSLLQ